MNVAWSKRALADLDRFAEFLNHHFPTMAPEIADALGKQAQLLAEQPGSGA